MRTIMNHFKESRFKRLLAMVLCLSMVLSLCPIPGQVHAEGICDHHPEHTPECGYVEAVEGQSCTHQHDASCGYQEAAACAHQHDGACGYREAVGCNHVCGDGNCGYAPKVECNHVHTEECGENGESCTHSCGDGSCAYFAGADCNHSHNELCGYQEAADCAHSCTDGTCGYREARDCAHQHDESCGYREAAEGKPCTFVCQECSKAQEPVPPATPVCSCENKCVEGNATDSCQACAANIGNCTGEAPETCGHGNDLATCEACKSEARVAAVQAQIDALPEDVTAEIKEAVQTALAAVDTAKSALTAEELAKLDNSKYTALAEKLAALEAELNKCAHGNDPAACEACASEARVAAVQALIDALPTVEELTEDTLTQTREQLATVKAAVEALTAEEQALLTLDKYTALTEYFAALDKAATEPTETEPEDIVVTDWQWIDEWEIIDVETGFAHLPFASVENIAYYESVLELLPWGILADGVELTLGEWTCVDYPQEGAYTGKYLFETTLPEGYAFEDGTNKLTLKVILGDPEGEPVSLYYTQDNISYLGANGENLTCNTATVVYNDVTNWTTGWYYVGSSRTFYKSVTVSGNVNLILGNNCTLTVNEGISVPQGSSLTIYAQSEAKVNNLGTVSDGNTAGQLVSKGNNDHAAIGGGANNAIGGTITIYGGIVKLDGSKMSVYVDTVNVHGGALVGGNDLDIDSTGIKANTINVYGGFVYGLGRASGCGIDTTSLNIQKGYVRSFSSGGICIRATTITTNTSDGRLVDIYAPELVTNTDLTTLNATVHTPEPTLYGNHKLTSDWQTNTNDFVTVANRATLTIPSGVTMTNNRTLLIKTGGTLTIESGGKLVNSQDKQLLREKDSTLNNNGTIEGGPFKWYATYFYNDDKGNRNDDKTASCEEYLSRDCTSLGVSGTGTWYAALENVTVSGKMTISGNTNLILGDGVTLTVPNGIEISSGSSLTIFSQKEQTGILSTGSSSISGDSLTIRGGTVSAGTINVSSLSAQKSVLSAGSITGSTISITRSASVFCDNTISYSDRSKWRGLVFEGTKGTVYDTPTISYKLTIPSGKALLIPEGCQLWVDMNWSLINYGAIYVRGELFIPSSSPSTPGSIYYALNLNGCSTNDGVSFGGKRYAAKGSTINLTRNPPSSGKMCTEWGAVGITLDVNTLSFIMPANVVSLNPVYQDIVAVVAGEEYADISTALAKADQSGQTLQLKKNVTDYVNYNVTNRLTFEGGAFELNASFTVSPGATFQVVNGTIRCTGSTNVITVGPGTADSPASFKMTGGAVCAEAANKSALVINASASCQLSGGCLNAASPNTNSPTILIKNGQLKTESLLLPGYAYYLNGVVVGAGTLYSDKFVSSVQIGRLMNVTRELSGASMAYGDKKSLRFDVQPVKSGDTVSYQWYVDGTQVGTNSGTLDLSSTKVGSHQVYCVASCHGYRLQSKTVTVSVKKAQPELKIKSNLTKEYDGTAYQGIPYIVTSGLENNVKVTYKLNNQKADPIHAGVYEIIAELPETESYKAATATGSLTITKRTVEIDWGTTTFTYDKQPHCPKPTAKSAVPGDSVNLVVNSSQAKTGVGIHPVSIDRLDNNDYELPKVTSTSFTIEPREVTIAGVTVASPSRTYDGTDSAIVAGVPTVEGVIPGDVVSVKLGTAAYEDKNAGSQKNVVFSGFALAGADAKNYTARQPASVKADITARDVTLTVMVKDKYYDGSTDITIGSAQLSGVLQGDEVIIVNGQGAFQTSQAGDDIEIVFTTPFSLSGADGGNYRITNPNPSGLTANIFEEYEPVKGTHYTVNSNDLQNTDFVVTAANGFQLSESNSEDGPWSDTLKVTKDGEGSLTFYVRDIAAGAISTAVTEGYKIDKTMPTGAILFGEADVTDRGGERARYDNGNISVTLTGSDTLSGVAKLAYCKSDKLLSTEQMDKIDNWQSGSQVTIPAAQEESFYLYAKVTDHAGNTAYFRSCQTIFDLTAPVISGVTDGTVSYTTQTATVNDDHLETLTLNGQPVTSPVPLPGDTDQAYTLIATDKAGNSTSVTITMRPLSTLVQPVEDVTVQNVTREDRQALEEAKAALQALPENATEAEKQKAEKSLDQIGTALETLENAAKVENQITGLPTSVQPDETEKEAEIKQARAAYEALSDDEKRLVDTEKLTKLEAELLDYRFLAGSGSTWNQDSEKELTFKANGALSKFSEVRLDGKIIDEADYSAASGSTIITLTPACLQSLSLGEHKIQIYYTDGNTEEASFEVKHSPNHLVVEENSNLADQTEVWVDGVAYPVESKEQQMVTLPGSGEYLTTYTYRNGNAVLSHDNYPTGMQVYRIDRTQDGAVLTPIPELDNLLRYSGSSIRITGKRGIRMITSLDENVKAALTGDGLAGFTLDEYGTVLCKASELNGNSLTLENGKHNFAYKKGAADPVFARTDGLIQYTNVLVGFSQEECGDDILMRPYIILRDAQGQAVTLYGGTVSRSIRYIAWQNQDTYQPGTDAYNYVHELMAQ